LLFRLHAEWLALPAKALAEVTSPRAVHRIPHRSSEVLAGLVNVRGQLLICVSLHHLLGVEPPDERPGSGLEAGDARRDNPRLVVLGSKAERWAFGADEARGMRRVSRGMLHAAPATLSKAAHGFSRAVFTYEDCTIGLLDEERVFAALRSLGT
jgi:chemotaxis-related protein WspD